MVLGRRYPKPPSYATQYGRQWLGMLPSLAGQALRGAVGGYMQDQRARAEHARRQELQQERLAKMEEMQEQRIEAGRGAEEREARRGREKQLFGGMARMAGEAGRPGMGAEILAKREAWRPPPTLGIPTEAAPAQPAIPGKPAQPPLPGRKVWEPGVPGMGLREEQKTPEAAAERFRQEMAGMDPAQKKKAQSAFTESYLPRLKLTQQKLVNDMVKMGVKYDQARMLAIGNMVADPYTQAMGYTREDIEAMFPAAGPMPQVPGAPYPGPRPGAPRQPRRPRTPPPKIPPPIEPEPGPGGGGFFGRSQWKLPGAGTTFGVPRTEGDWVQHFMSPAGGGVDRATAIRAARKKLRGR